ncbi:Rossmann-like and DUF2520 domain-containing protein [Engelhardtia mirabilis]|uniref:Rossmann-like domain protein n=1 Tax=Engelhardtia mirabilis TaxID=2528011 RepID=A0A518BMN8_9BACT|nr:Rossmann-like domain protein [Planctomycetes bacterium Pla133]QDV02543.1 Rossmann-like domain protein [Planctomycetes bacterium Pla86]
MNERIGIVGLGSVGAACARALTERGGGRAVLAWTRSYERREFWTRHPGIEMLEGPEAVAREADLLLFCVTDAALAEVAGRCATAGAGRGRVALHTAGAEPPSVLSPLSEVGWEVGVAHPLLSIVVDEERTFEGAAFGLFGSAAAKAAGGELVRALGGEGIELDGDGVAQARYHAAAALLSNGLVGLFAQATDEFERCGASPEGARTAARSLLLRTTDNLARLAPAVALTGPLRRGEAARIESHLAALDPEVAVTYRALSRRLLALVSEDLEPARIDALRRLLDGQ